mmetsp:Transcript_23503/g.57727  ORF Transcript_23503/g.57727 Transcript_23503/m.57727 type:complete len:93 (+) Transcript_23503:88-366(+)
MCKYPPRSSKSVRRSTLMKGLPIMQYHRIMLNESENENDATPNDGDRPIEEEKDSDGSTSSSAGSFRLDRDIATFGRVICQANHLVDRVENE